MIDQDFWPTPDMFLSLESVTQITDGRARCTGVTVCNDDGQVTRHFQHGQAAHFFYEFEILEPLEIASGGLEFHNAANYVVHGKNTFQHGPQPQPVAAGDRLRYHHVINLEVAPGKYWFTVGLASSSTADFEEYRVGNIGHEQFNAFTSENCRVINISSFMVELAASAKLLNHGVANLPSEVAVTIVPGTVELAAPTSISQSSAANDDPMIIHVTHWKAGSQWIYRILQECVPDRIVPPQPGVDQYLYWPLQPGKIYPTVYLTKPQFERVQLPANSHHFVVIRDLRDSLISAYFSVKLSHPMMGTNMDYLRPTLQSMSTQDGLIYMMDHWLPGCANIQFSWVEAGGPLIRYEDLLVHDLEILEPLLLDTCRLPVSRERFREVVLASRFKSITQGRERGVEDVNAHQRKGIAGDWQNHFTEALKRAFKIRYGGLLVATGYEQDLNW